LLRKVVLTRALSLRLLPSLLRLGLRNLIVEALIYYVAAFDAVQFVVMPLDDKSAFNSKIVNAVVVAYDDQSIDFTSLSIYPTRIISLGT